MIDKIQQKSDVAYSEYEAAKEKLDWVISRRPINDKEFILGRQLQDISVFKLAQYATYEEVLRMLKAE
jgi:hypothetical protein